MNRCIIRTCTFDVQSWKTYLNALNILANERRIVKIPEVQEMWKLPSANNFLSQVHYIQYFNL